MARPNRSHTEEGGAPVATAGVRLQGSGSAVPPESSDELTARAKHSYQRAEQIIEEWHTLIDEWAHAARVARVSDNGRQQNHPPRRPPPTSASVRAEFLTSGRCMARRHRHC